MSFDAKQIALLLALSLLTGCAGSPDMAPDGSTVTDTSSSSLSVSRLDTNEMFTDRDLDGSDSVDDAALITLSGSGAFCESKNVSVDGNLITISGEGTYVLTGSLEGQIIVDGDNSDKIQLILKDAEIHCPDSAAIYVKQADKVFLTLAQNTENILSTTGDFVQTDDNNVDAVVFSKDDLTVNGSGTLSITTEYGHGIVSKDDLVITSGTLNITASGHALSGKDSVRVANGTFVLTSAKDGIHSENSDNTALGYIYIAGGSFSIVSEGDGLDASNLVQIDGGTIDIAAGGGSVNTEGKSNHLFGKQSQGEPQSEDTGDVDTSSSTKGIKGNLAVFVDGGTITIDAADDAIHANGSVQITDGALTLSSGDDGIHADDALDITGGTIDIPTSYEGIEGKTISISAGTISVVSSDDGLNAAGGNDGSGMEGPMGGADKFSTQKGVSITISGGMLTIDAEGDGIDSNGDLTITGGSTYVFGPENSGNGALDHGGTATISGGTLVALSCSSMEEPFDESSTQGTIALSLSHTVSGALTLTDTEGSVLLDCTPIKRYSVLQLSCPELIQGEYFTLTTGEETTELQMDSLHYNTLSHMDGMDAMGGKGQMPSGREPASDSADSSLPENPPEDKDFGGRNQKEFFKGDIPSDAEPAAPSQGKDA